MLNRIEKLHNKLNLDYIGDVRIFNRQVATNIMKRVNNDINKITDKLIQDTLYLQDLIWGGPTFYG